MDLKRDLLQNVYWALVMIYNFCIKKEKKKQKHNLNTYENENFIF